MSFNTALSGLNAASAELGVVSNNVANSSTIGFKESRTEFADVYSVSALGSSSTAIGSGVLLSNVAQQFNQGNLEFTDNTLDMAISGEGFFTISPSATAQEVFYSRAGNFSVDANGYVVNSQGYFLQAYPVNPDGSVSSTTTQPLTLPSASGVPQASTEIELGMNLPSSGTASDPANFDPANTATYTSSTSLTVYDSLGASHLSTTYFVKDINNANTWAAFHYVDGVPVDLNNDQGQANYDTEGDAVPDTTADYVTLQFNGAGALTGTTPAVVQTDPANLITFANGAANMSLILDFASNSPTQFASPFNVTTLSQDGHTTGKLSGLDVGDTGLIQANYTNGTSTPLGVITLSKFPNPQGLRQVGNTAWEESLESGTVLPGRAGNGGFGLIRSGALEGSNVDLTEQLVKLITAQRNFQANAKSIETNSAVTQTIIQLR